MSAPDRSRVARTPESDTGLHEEAANDAGWPDRAPGPPGERGRLPSESEVRRLFEARLTDVAANKLARRWVELYTAAAGKERRLMLSALAPLSARPTYAGDGGEGVRFFKRLNAQSQGLRFLDLRADLRWRKQVADAGAGQGTGRAAVGLVRRGPAGVASADLGLARLAAGETDSYEAVHEITSWDDLRHRVAPDRRCYAYFHPQMPGVPLIFVEVAFAGQMAGNVQALLDSSAPPQDLDKARWAIFYSISNTQPGLKGISFGNFLLKRVVEQLLQELPKLKSFATLSPIPGFSDWLGKLDAKAVQGILRDGKGRERDGGHDGQRWVAHLSRAAAGKAPEAARAGFRLAAHYLQSMKNGAPLDAVARFHLGNGARIERLNWAADTSARA